MSDDNNVFVGIHLDPLKAATPAGVLTFSESGDGRVWFEYNPRYIEMIDDGSAFELAPSGLKATKSPIELPNAEYPGVFGDSAPDFWGQLVLRRLFGLNNITPVERLVYSGEDRIGALTFRHRSIRGRSSALPTKNVLSRYGRFIMSMEDGAAPLTDEDLKAAALAGSSAGGARPKCSFREDDGTVWLAKFSLPKDAPLPIRLSPTPTTYRQRHFAELSACPPFRPCENGIQADNSCGTTPSRAQCQTVNTRGT